MAYLQPDKPEKVYLPAIRAAKEKGEKLVCLTAYDYPTARIVDEAGVDIILVGDSIGNVIHGYGNTIPVSLDEISSACIAVKRGTERAMVVADMPYGTYHVNEDESVRNALRLMKYGGAEAVKLEGGRNRVDLVKRLVNEEIPVVAHIGLTPQSVNALGGFKLQGKNANDARRLIDEAVALERAGCFSIVLECVPTELAAIITEQVSIPTIGIGAGPSCDGQVLVFHDVLGIYDGHTPKFVRRYANAGADMQAARETFLADVREGRFPDDEKESFHMASDEELKRLYASRDEDGVSGVVVEMPKAL
jgi:3-methyl-2-oxobutanoate hydroxymethyltransferase